MVQTKYAVATIHIDVPNDKITTDRLKNTSVIRKGQSAKDVPEWGETAKRFLSIPNLFRFIFFGIIISVTTMVCVTPEYHVFIWATPVISVVYFFYWIDILCLNTTFKFLAHTKFVLDLFKHVDEVKLNGIPSIVWHMECYHMETRTRIVSMGKGRTSVQTYQVRVTTWTGDRAFAFKSFQDFSDELKGMFESKAIRVTFRKIYRFVDDRTKMAYEQQYKQFLAANMGRDRQYTIGEAFKITGYQKRAMSFVDGVKPWYMNWWWYLLAAIPLLEMPYNFLIKKNSRKLEFIYVKELTV